MARELVWVNWKKYLVNLMGLFLLCGNSLVHGFEPGPIIVVGGFQIYKLDPQSACIFRFYDLNPVVNPNILKLGVTPIPDNSSSPTFLGPTTAYEWKQVAWISLRHPRSMHHQG